jgi:hypothetical protein
MREIPDHVRGHWPQPDYEPWDDVTRSDYEGAPQVPAANGNPVRTITCTCDWPYGHCETCARVWGYTAVHMTADGTCAMYGHRERAGREAAAEDAAPTAGKE